MNYGKQLSIISAKDNFKWVSKVHIGKASNLIRQTNLGREKPKYAKNFPHQIHMDNFCKVLTKKPMTLKAPHLEKTDIAWSIHVSESASVTFKDQMFHKTITKNGTTMQKTSQGQPWGIPLNYTTCWKICSLIQSTARKYNVTCINK